MGPPPDPRGHLPFIPYSGFTSGTPVFTHYTSSRQRYAIHEFGSEKQQYNLKINRDGYLKKSLFSNFQIDMTFI